MTIVYISIGNSDDKLTQREWSEYVTKIDDICQNNGWPIVARHGSWRSLPDAPWQNACWCIEIGQGWDRASNVEEAVSYLKNALKEVAGSYRQESVAWAEATTEFLRPGIA